MHYLIFLGKINRRAAAISYGDIAEIPLLAGILFLKQRGSTIVLYCLIMENLSEHFVLIKKMAGRIYFLEEAMMPFIGI